MLSCECMYSSVCVYESVCEKDMGQGVSMKVCVRDVCMTLYE